MLTPESVAEKVRPVVEEKGFVLVETKVQMNHGRPKFVFNIDHRERNITIGEMTSFSRAFEDILDLWDDVPRQYALDVSSPGVGRPLREDWEFRKNIGRELKLKVHGDNPGEKPRRLTGTLEAVEGSELVIEGGERIPLAKLISAKVKLPW